MKNKSLWQPSADISTLRQRASIIQSIRQFFIQRDVLEVDTPYLSQYSVTDPHLVGFKTEFVGPGYAQGLPLFLQTSPEYAMKRLLAAGSGDIFQLSRAFRNEEAGRYHNPEFTMLEWYRVGYDHNVLMDEVEQLIQHVLDTLPAERISYQNAFIQHLHCDPLTATLNELKLLAQKHGYGDIAETELNSDTLLQLLFSQCVEPHLGQEVPCFVFDFPASQAALAQVNAEDNRVAHRFELYYKNNELANGFFELTDAEEQRARFIQDNMLRQQMGLAPVAIDDYLLSALEAGLPSCAGVALGVDRLVMLALNKQQISEVLAFDVNRA